MTAITYGDKQVFDPILRLCLATLARAQSFSQAGRRLGLGQSTVNQH
jgi:hypothetical protein